ncbi:hypothetical protein CLOHYLEM_05555 [[Clostridium] hylemonae DSM 15053]|uniref:Uncharacterized protein n=1 Tax=[Clostridium] hylemonae DSM 15053 TaxID=553973 RepID=C0C0G1_9FIRM|nr:hypothetical protein CLOHYLEM_05555 [[Clostridium] hylemonae DSM 15053]
MAVHIYISAHKSSFLNTYFHIFVLRQRPYFTASGQPVIW